MKPKTVDSYISGFDDWRAEAIARIREIVLRAEPPVLEAFKWSQPVYEMNGPFCYIKAFKQSVNFGFWRGVDLEDPKGILQGTGVKMRHIKLTSLEDIDEEVFLDFVQQAMQLNLEKGDPTKGD
jgi:hypothetical protein